MKVQRFVFLRVVSAVFSIFLVSEGLTACRFARDHLLPAPPDEEVAPAVVRTRTLLRREGRDSISIKAVDGAPPTLLEFKWVLTPTTHKLEVEVELYEDSPAVKDRTYVTKIRRFLDVTLTPGTEYVVDARKVGETVYIWVARISDGQVIAGEAPHGNTLPGFERGLER